MVSKDAVGRFRDLVNADEALQAELRGLEDVSGKDLVALAARHGQEFSVEELNSVARELAGDLTDFELEMVTGGTWHVRRNAAQTIPAQPMAEPEKTESDPLC